MTGEGLERDVQNKYTAADIQVLEGLEAVRRNVPMYVGGINERGLHHLFLEVCDNAVDEALAGHCDRIDVVLYADGSVSIKDNGRGIPVSFNELYKMPDVELMFTKLFLGQRGQHNNYKVSGPLRGIGIACINALSDWLMVTIRRDGKIYQIGFERGITTQPLHVIGDTASDHHGTMVHWHPDPLIFGEHRFNAEKMEWRLRELAYLHKDLTLTFANERDQTDAYQSEHLSREERLSSAEIEKTAKQIFHYPHGLTDFVAYLTGDNQALHEPVCFSEKHGTTLVEIAFQYHAGRQSQIFGYANSILMLHGGTHLTGFKSALTRGLNRYARKTGLLPEDEANFSGEEVNQGLSAVVSVHLLGLLLFESATRTILGNREILGIVHSIMSRKLASTLEQNPDMARKIIDNLFVWRHPRTAATTN